MTKVNLLGVLPTVSAEQKREYLEKMASQGIAFVKAIRSIIITRFEKIVNHKIDDEEFFKKNDTAARTRKEYLNSILWLEGKKTDLVCHCKGIEVICKMLKISGEELAERFGIVEEKSEGYCPQKALNKLAQLFAVIGGASNSTVKVPKQERILDSHIENGLYKALREYKQHREALFARDTVTGQFLPSSQIKAGEFKTAFGYRALIDDAGAYKIDPELSAKIDSLIDAGAASYETSTINTQSAQVKSALLSIGAAIVIVRTKEGEIVAKGRAKGMRGQILAPKAAFMRLIEKMDASNYPLILRDDKRQ